MRLIAIRGFKNNAKEVIEMNGEPVHADGVHKGARFTIGGDKPLKEIKDKRLLELIGALHHTESLGDANDADLCKRIDEEVKTEGAQRKAAAAANATGSTVEIARAVVAALQELNAVKAPRPTAAAGA